MDATRHSTIRIITIIGFTAATFAGCNQMKTETPTPQTATEYVYADQYGPPAQALAALENYLQTITTTTTTVTQYRYTQTPDGNMWDVLAFCESSGDWGHLPVAGGFSGGLMFHIGTWRAMGGTEYAPDAYLATREQQIDIAERTRTAAGGSMRAWPGCANKHGWN
jgi:hypothetical protein